MTWCENDCHKQPMWCGRKNCLSKGDYADLMKKKRNNGSKNENNDAKNNNTMFNDDVKVALAALTTAEDYSLLEVEI